MEPSWQITTKLIGYAELGIYASSFIHFWQVGYAVQAIPMSEIFFPALGVIREASWGWKQNEQCYRHAFLVGGIPTLWKIWKSVGISIPNVQYGKLKDVPNYKADFIVVILLDVKVVRTTRPSLRLKKLCFFLGSNLICHGKSVIATSQNGLQLWKRITVMRWSHRKCRWSVSVG